MVIFIIIKLIEVKKMLSVKLSIATTRAYEFNGKKYVQISGMMFGRGLFKISVPEQVVPDSLEGKECTGVFDIGIDGKTFKPYLKLVGIEE